MHYLWWVPLTILYYVVATWLSYKSNLDRSFHWPIYLYLYGGLIQVWVFVSIVSKNILFDGLLFDLLMVSTFAITMTYLTGSHLSVWQVGGILLAIAGLLLMKMG